VETLFLSNDDGGGELELAEGKPEKSDVFLGGDLF